MIKAFQLLYKGRMVLENLQTEEEIRKIIQSELKDEFTHPRARLSLEKKYLLAMTRIDACKLSDEERQSLVDAYKEEYLKLSIGYEV